MASEQSDELVKDILILSARCKAFKFMFSFFTDIHPQFTLETWPIGNSPPMKYTTGDRPEEVGSMFKKAIEDTEE